MYKLTSQGDIENFKTHITHFSQVKEKDEQMFCSRHKKAGAT